MRLQKMVWIGVGISCVVSAICIGLGVCALVRNANECDKRAMASAPASNEANGKIETGGKTEAGKNEAEKEEAPRQPEKQALNYAAHPSE